MGALSRSCLVDSGLSIYAAFFKESPEGLNFNTVIETKLDANGKDPDGNDPKIVFDENTKNLIQKTAFDALMAFNKNTE